MTELASISLENEMDLTLAYKKTMRVAELLGLTIATQTAFATAVSEVCREVIDKAFDGTASLGALPDGNRFFISARITCQIDEYFNRGNEGLEYARKLVPILEVEAAGEMLTIALKLAIPRSAGIDQRKVNAVKTQLTMEGPMSAYEEVKQKNAALAQLNQQQELALANAAYLDRKKNEFLAVASHELNSPLTVLRSCAQIALRVDKGENPDLTRFILKIENQSTKLVNWVRQLMDVSRLEEGKLTYQREKVYLPEYLAALQDSLQLLVNTHQLTINPETQVFVAIDRLRIEQVLMNLVGNAAKYSEAGRPIHIRTELADDRVMIRVEDQGIGMNAETTARVFEKFYRSEAVEKKYSGLGMGLYLASRIVVDHGGAISIASEEGRGSVISFSLPVTAGAG